MAMQRQSQAITRIFSAARPAISERVRPAGIAAGPQAAIRSDRNLTRRNRLPPVQRRLRVARRSIACLSSLAITGADSSSALTAATDAAVFRSLFARSPLAGSGAAAV